MVEMDFEVSIGAHRNAGTVWDYGYPAWLSLLWTLSYAETYHGTPEGDMNFQTELVGESSCAIETNHDRGSSPWGDVASALVEGLGACRAPD